MFKSRNLFLAILASVAGVTLCGGVRAHADESEYATSPVTMEDAVDTTPAQPSNTEASVSVTGEGASTLKTSKKSSWSEAKRNISTGFFNFSSVKANEVNRGYGKLESYNYLSLEYRLGRGEKVFYRPAFLFNFAGSDARNREVPSKFEWSDGYFGYVNYNLPWLPFAMDYKTEIRAYIPTSEFSQKAGMIGRLRGDLKAFAPLTSRSIFFLWFKPDYYIQSKTATADDRGFARGNRNFGYELSANYYYTMNRMLGLGSALGHEQYWTHASAAEGLDVIRSEDLFVSGFLGVSYRGLLTHIGFEQTRSLSRPRNSFELLRDSETQYFARSYYRF